jgi:hypothetical protein
MPQKGGKNMGVNLEAQLFPPFLGFWMPTVIEVSLHV